MRRGQENGTRMEMREAQRYGQGSLSLLGCSMTRTTPSYRLFDGYTGPVKVYDERVKQCFVIRLRNHGDTPLHITGVESRVWDYWCLRPNFGFTLDYRPHVGSYQMLLGRTGSKVHPVECVVSARACTDLIVSTASSVAHIACTALYALDLRVHYGEEEVTEASKQMVLAVDHHFSDYDWTPGNDGYDAYNPFDEPEQYDIHWKEKDWRALRRFAQYPGLKNREFLDEYRWYSNECESFTTL